MDYSTKEISISLSDEIKQALQGIDYGSVELYVQDNKVIQITRRIIRKTSVSLKEKGSKSKRG